MAIVQCQTTSFKLNLYQQYFLNSGYTFAVALYTSAASLDGTVTAYTPVGEVVGTGYTSGGNVATVASVSFDANSGTAFVTFNNVGWTGASFVARAALLYNAAVNNESIAVIDFGSDISCTSTGNFTIVMPGSTYTTALIRSS